MVHINCFLSHVCNITGIHYPFTLPLPSLLPQSLPYCCVVWHPLSHATAFSGLTFHIECIWQWFTSYVMLNQPLSREEMVKALVMGTVKKKETEKYDNVVKTIVSSYNCYYNFPMCLCIRNCRNAPLYEGVGCMIVLLQQWCQKCTELCLWTTFN